MSEPRFSRVGDFALTWGESLRWDDRRGRLYFVDCATQTLHWLDGLEDGGEGRIEGPAPELQTLRLPSMAAGIALTDGPALVACLGDGLYVVDPDAGSWELLAPYPDGMYGRANDANADGAGNLVTGTLNLGPGPGALWWFSAVSGWRLLDDPFGNTNGPVVIEASGETTLVVGDTNAASVYAYPYDPGKGTVGDRRVFGDHNALDGAPDGATADEEDGVWSCVLRSGKLARYTPAGLDRVVDLPVANPSDVAFGGPALDRLFVTSIALDLGEGTPPAPESGWLLALDGLGVAGRPEPRFAL